MKRKLLSYVENKIDQVLKECSQTTAQDILTGFNHSIRKINPYGILLSRNFFQSHGVLEYVVGAYLMIRCELETLKRVNRHLFEVTTRILKRNKFIDCRYNAINKKSQIFNLDLLWRSVEKRTIAAKTWIVSLNLYNSDEIADKLLHSTLISYPQFMFVFDSLYYSFSNEVLRSRLGVIRPTRYLWMHQINTDVQTLLWHGYSPAGLLLESITWSSVRKLYISLLGKESNNCDCDNFDLPIARFPLLERICILDWKNDFSLRFPLFSSSLNKRYYSKLSILSSPSQKLTINSILNVNCHHDVTNQIWLETHLFRLGHKRY